MGIFFSFLPENFLATNPNLGVSKQSPSPTPPRNPAHQHQVFGAPCDVGLGAGNHRQLTNHGPETVKGSLTRAQPRRVLVEKHPRQSACSPSSFQSERATGAEAGGRGVDGGAMDLSQHSRRRRSLPPSGPHEGVPSIEARLSALERKYLEIEHMRDVCVCAGDVATVLRLTRKFANDIGTVLAKVQGAMAARAPTAPIGKPAKPTPVESNNNAAPSTGDPPAKKIRGRPRKHVEPKGQRVWKFRVHFVLYQCSRESGCFFTHFKTQKTRFLFFYSLLQCVIIISLCL